MNCIHLDFLTDDLGRKFLSPTLPEDGLNEKVLHVTVSDRNLHRTYPLYVSSKKYQRHSCIF